MRRRSAAYWRQTQHKSRRSRGVRLESLEDRAVPSGLSVSLADRQILEGQVTTGTVTRNTADVSLPLNVVLHSSDITAATVPPSVVIPAGQISATFPVVGVDDPYLDGTQPVVITAEASLPPTFDQQNPSLMAYNTQTMATLPDGRYVTAGLRYIGPGPNAYDVAVSRFLSNGLSDQSFGSGGTVYTPIAAGSYDAPTVILPQSDGKILVAGNTAPEFTPYKTTMFVLRYNTNGTLDTTFGVGGKVVLDFGPNTLAEVHDLTFGASGTIYLAGMLDRFDGSFGDFAVVRLTATGAMDPTWGGSGVVTTGFQDRDTIYEAVPQTDGKLVVAGQAGGNGPTSLLALARYNTNGTLDATFGTGGKVTVDLPGTEEGLTDFIFSFGKILAVGQVRPTGATPDNPHDWVIAQFNPNGAIEPSFGNGGFITYDIGGDDQAQSLVQMSDGTFTVGGYGAGTVAGSSRRPIAAQFSPDGRSMLMSLVVPRPDAVGLDLVYQNSTLRLAGTSSYWAGGFVENLVPGSGGFTTASDGLSVLDNEEGPSVQPDAYDALEDTTLYASNYPPTYGVLFNDYSPNGTLTASLVSGPAHGALTLNPDGTFAYTPAPNYNGPDSFVYRATDPYGASGTSTVSITVQPMNDPTVLTVPGPQTTAEDTPLTFSAANGNAITITDVENPRILVSLLLTDGILTLPSTAGLEFPNPGEVNNSKAITFYADNPAEANSALNGLVFTPAANKNGPHALSITVRDETILPPSPPVQVYANVGITVTPVNDAPVAAPDAYETWEDFPLAVYGLGVLANDQDVDGDPLTAVLVSGPSHGTVTLNPNGSFTYTPAPNYNGSDSFTYRAVDPSGLSSVATVSLNIIPMDDPTTLTVPGPQTTLEDTPLTFSAATGNAIVVIDPESPRVLVSLLVSDGILTLPSTAGLEFPNPGEVNNSKAITFYADNPAEANAALNGLVFTPAANKNGLHSLSVMVRDMTSTSFPPITATGLVSINVTPVNDAPVAVADGPYTVESGDVLWVDGYSTPGVLVNDLDYDSDPLSAGLDSGPAHGTLTLNPNGSFTYTPEATFIGTDTFTYRASDGVLLSSPATVTINVIPRNLPPVTVADAYSVDEDGTLNVPAPGFLGNDTGPEGQPLTASLVVGQAHGTLVFYSDGHFTYTPPANYHGPDEFWYRASDGVKVSEPTRVLLTVNSVNDAPVAANDAYSLDEDTPLTVAAPGVLANDTDIDGDTLTAAIVTGPAHGTVNLNSNGSFTYTPDLNYYGADSFTYRAVDPDGAASVATVTLTIRPVNDAPVAVDDTYAATEDGAVSAAVAGTTSVTMVSDPGDYIGQGRTYNFTPATGTFTISRNYDNGVSLRYESATEWWNWDFAAPGDALLVPGLYAGAVRWPFQSASQPGLSVTGDGRGSNTLTGWFRINDIAYGPAGEVLVFSATFEQHSEGGTPALRGEVRYNAGGTAPGGVLLNDSDAEGSPLTASLVTGPTHGRVWLNPNGTFTYVPDANFAGVDTFRYKVSDGTLDSNVATATVNVAAVNDAPVNTVPGMQTLVEDTTKTFSSANGNAIRLTDVDAGDAVVQLQLSVMGFLTFPTTAGLTFVNGSNGSSFMTVRGTLADLNTALDGLVYRPGANLNGDYTLSVMTSDLGNTGSGGSKTDSDSVTLRISPVNDPPQNVVPLVAPTTTEDTPLAFNPVVWVTDVDQFDYGASGRPVEVTLDVVSGGGTLTVTSGVGGPVTGSGTGHVTVYGSIQNVNNALQTLRFVPAANANDLTTTSQVRMTTNDLANGGGDPLYDIDTFTIHVTPVNDAPVLTLSAAPVSVPMNGGAAAVAGFASAVAGPADEASQTISYEVEVLGTTGSLTFAAAPVVSADGTLRFTPAVGTWGTASVRVRARDNGGTANGGIDVSPYQTFTIAVTDAAPTASGLSPVAVDEDAPATSITLTKFFADIEDGPAGLTYSLVGNTNPGLFSSASVVGGALTLNYAANAYGTATLTVRATDSGGLWVEAPLPVTVNPVNDAPTSGALPPVAVTEDADPVNLTLTNYFADVEDGAAGLTYALVGNTNPGLFSSAAISSGVLNLAFAANANGSATLTVRATDTGGLSVEVPLAVTVTPVNDAPTSGGLPPVTVAEDAAPTALTLTDHFADIEDGAAGLTYAVVGNTNPGLFSSVGISGGVLTLAYGPNAYGSATLTVRATDSGGLSVEVPLAVTVTPVNDAPTSGGLPGVTVEEDADPVNLTLTNYFADIEDGATGLTYSVVGNTNPGLFSSVAVSSGILTLGFVANANGSATLTVRATDTGGLTVDVPLVVTVTPVNDSPTSSGLSPVTVAEDAAPVAVTLTDSFTDVEDGAAGLTYSVVGNTNPAVFSSVSVSGGTLTLGFTANANGSATLTVRATDSGGLTVEVPLAVTVTPVNDAPTSSGLPAVSVTEDAAPTGLTLTNYFADVEDGPAGLTYSVVGNTNPGQFGQVSVSGGVLTLAYGPNANGSASLTVRATDSGGLWVDAPLAVTVTPVNDAPSFTAGPNITVASDAGAQSLAGWASAISRGPADEAGQTLAFSVSADNPLLFALQPAIDPATGTLTFTPVAGASGTTTVTVVLGDNGGTANGGVDSSAPVTFTITLNPPALPPGMQVIGTTLVITGGAGNDSVSISTISAGNGSNGAKVTGTLNGQSVNQTFRQTLTQIRVSVGGGNDTVTIADAITIPTVIDAGAGADSVKGGGGSDLVFGGAGNDTISAAAGDDNVDAGAGNDSIIGGLGRDLLMGGTGDDIIQGGDGNDLLIGGLGADQLFGQNGDDILVAGSVVVRNPASDSLRQVLTDWNPAAPGNVAGLRDRLVVTDDPASVDQLQGNVGTDWFWSSDPTDVLDIGLGEERN